MRNRANVLGFVRWVSRRWAGLGRGVSTGLNCNPTPQGYYRP